MPTEPEAPAPDAPTEPEEPAEPVDPTAYLVTAVADARALAAKINGGELEWAAAVEEHDTLGRGGKMGTLKKGEMSPAIEAAVLAIEAGQVTEPVVMGEMIFLIKVVTVKEGGALPYDQVADRIRAAIFDEKIEDELDQWYQQTRRQAALSVLLEAP